MSLGKLKAQAKFVHIGALKLFGFEQIMLDAEGERGAPKTIPVLSEDMLNHPDIQACINGGLLIHTSDDEDEDAQEVVEQPVPVLEESPAELVSEAPADDTQETVETPAEDAETHAEEPATPEEPADALGGLSLSEALNAQDTVDTEEQDNLFEQINGLRVSDAKAAMEDLTDVELLSRLAAKAKLSGTQHAAQKRLEELNG